MAKVLRMTFATSEGGSFQLNIPDPLDTLDSTAIANAMDLIITKNVFTTKKGNLVSKKDAVVVETTMTDLYTPAV
ncbi:DUF2922 domain-containing protein [Heliophilum fasciatum]|uniref:DUF2922 family protein n=1 Tax=Heliophilum fasciatum TaxID=35700 RepID=A0A4R2S0E5_9FIRM|nr:DUF2922 domain-containing protein [Heliophilum fasciatum]MCW2276893.1 hypothetical protein [Heliophilum fasciatum]TCP68647.1 DUF2922 family protein [Heliophilum fasciatum]